jgi:uncharacterized protein (TIGR03435 family)
MRRSGDLVWMLGVAATVAMLWAPLTAQERLAFDVVSIKRTPPETRSMGFGFPPGRFITTNYAVKALLVLAYGVAGFQIGDLPGWTETERFDIDARMPPGPFTQHQRAAMIQTLLVERFKLKTHREQRGLPAYALVLARSDGKLGPALRQTKLNCDEVRARRAAGGTGPTTPEQLIECGLLPSGLPGGARRMRAQGVPISDLALALTSSLDRPVFDGTGLTGFFDLDLTFLPQAGGPATAAQSDAPSIFTAVHEQLGLKLEATTNPVDMLVIDSIERPTEN